MSDFTPAHAEIMKQMKFCPVCGVEMRDLKVDEKPEFNKKRCPDDHTTFVWGFNATSYGTYLEVVTDEIAMLG